jgi:PAS domain S-box-containing protein
MKEERKVSAAPDDESFRLLFAGNPLPMWVYDLETLAFLEINDAAVARYGYSRQEFLQMRISDIRPGADAERLLADVRSPRPVLQYSGEWRHRLRDGRLIDVEIASHTLQFRGHSAALVVVHDVTDRKQAEAALRRSEARKAAILEAALDCVITIDDEGRVVDFNPAAERTFAYQHHEVVGRPLAELIIPPDLRQAHINGLARYRQTGSHAVLNRRIELRGMRSDGTEFPVELAITPIQGHERPMFTGYIRDISDRKRAEEDLLRLNAELEERVVQRTAQLEAAVEELEAFSYAVSHDLRAPLRAIDGFSQVLLEDHGNVLNEDARSVLGRVRAASQRMAELIDDLLDLSRLTRAEMVWQPIDVTALAERIAADLKKTDLNRNATFRIEKGLLARGDERLLRVALENLLSNAWKFTGRVAEAQIEVGRMNGTKTDVFFVRDNGAGFDMNHAHKLFGVFERLHSVREFPGTGVGLTTVRRVVHRHGGRVWADAAVGRGATFFFTLRAE